MSGLDIWFAFCKLKNKKYKTMINLFKDPFFDVLDASRFNQSTPQVTVEKIETEYIVQMSVPGLTKEDLKISIKDGILKISHEKEEKTDKIYFVTNFTKSYRIPEDVKERDIEGKVENGILTLTLPLDKKKPIERLISLN